MFVLALEPPTFGALDLPFAVRVLRMRHLRLARDLADELLTTVLIVVLRSNRRAAPWHRSWLRTPQFGQQDANLVRKSPVGPLPCAIETLQLADFDRIRANSGAAHGHDAM